MVESTRLTAQLALMIQKSERSLQAAKGHIGENDFDFAVSRAYYSAFYLMEAILLTKELSFSTHSGVMNGFHQHFLKTKVFSQEFGRSLSRLLQERQVGDYEFESNLTVEDAQQNIQFAEDFMHTIKDYLTKEGFLSVSESQ